VVREMIKARCFFFGSRQAENALGDCVLRVSRFPGMEHIDCPLLDRPYLLSADRITVIESTT
jgi:hypothetical protein